MTPGETGAANDADISAAGQSMQRQRGSEACPQTIRTTKSAFSAFRKSASLEADRGQQRNEIGNVGQNSYQMHEAAEEELPSLKLSLSLGSENDERPISIQLSINSQSSLPVPPKTHRDRSFMGTGRGLRLLSSKISQGSGSRGVAEPGNLQNFESAEHLSEAVEDRDLAALLNRPLEPLQEREMQNHANEGDTTNFILNRNREDIAREPFCLKGRIVDSMRTACPVGSQHQQFTSSPSSAGFNLKDSTYSISAEQIQRRRRPGVLGHTLISASPQSPESACKLPTGRRRRRTESLVHSPDIEKELCRRVNDENAADISWNNAGNFLNQQELCNSDNNKKILYGEKMSGLMNLMTKIMLSGIE